VTPAPRLLAAVAALAVAALALVPAPWLGAPLAGAGGVLLALAIWDALLLRARPPLRLERRLPERAFVGREARLVLRLANPSRSRVQAAVEDELPPDLEATGTAFPFRPVPAGGHVELALAVRPRRRGSRPLGAALVCERSPLGLLERRSAQGAGRRLEVHPDTRPYLCPEALDPQRVLAALGVRSARPRGEGLEFESLREWVPGDDPRRLDWAASARRGRPVVRLHQHERSHTVLLAVDASRLMAARSGGRSKLDHAVDAALALAFAALATGDRVGLVVFDTGVRGALSPRGRRGDLGAFVEALRAVEPRLVESNPAAVVEHLALRRVQRALVVVLTDFVEAAAPRIVTPFRVLARRHQVLLVALRDASYDALAAPPDPDAADAFGLARRLVLDDLLRERESALALLRRQGVETLDLRPERVTAAVLNRYLALRHGPGR